MAASELGGPGLSGASARIGWLVVLFCLAVAGLLAAQVVMHGPMLELDRDVSMYFAAHRQPAITALMSAVSAVHQTIYVLAATALVALWRALRRDWHSAGALLVVPAGMLLNWSLKLAFRRARPAWDDPLVQLASYSFPSGHAIASTVFYGMLCALVFAHTRSPLLRGLAAAAALFMVALVCFSRVYLGAHYPSDVIAGAAVGTACVLLFLRPLRR
jgi:membrane-associated phospholipid phosphatase